MSTGKSISKVQGVNWLLFTVFAKMYVPYGESDGICVWQFLVYSFIYWELFSPDKRKSSKNWEKSSNQKASLGTSPAVQWMRVRLPMQGTLVQESPTRGGAAKPVPHNYWSPRALEPGSRNYWACTPSACAPQQEEPPPWKPTLQQSRPPRSN